MRRCALGLVWLLGSACASPPAVCPECEPPSDALRALEGTSWLVRRVTFPDDEMGRAPGFDLDGRDSGEGSGEREATCEEHIGDFASTLEAPIVGVDNAGQELRYTGELFFDGETFDGELATALEAGVLRWAISIGALSEGRGGEADELVIELSLVEDGEPIALEDGIPAAGQALEAHVVARTTARVSGSAAWGSTEASAPIGGDVFLLPFGDLRLGGLAVQAVSPSLLRAQLGGSFSVDALVERFDEATGSAWNREDVRRAFELVADLEPSEEPRTCTRMSAGFELEAVPVALSER